MGLESCGPEAPGHPTREQLEVVIRKVLAIKQAVETGAVPQPELRHRTLARELVDEWPLGHDLATDVIELEDAYIRLP
jgi:hypothetical protein